jgi:hypothetical protein
VKWEHGHPYAWRTWLRGRIPWFLINLGVAAKGADCEAVGARHHWYNIDGQRSGCYHCSVTRPGRLWHSATESESALLLNIDLPLRRATLHTDDCSYVPNPVGTALKPVGALGRDGGWFQVESSAAARSVLQRERPDLVLTECSHCMR